jgi:hypothetical protein
MLTNTLHGMHDLQPIYGKCMPGNEEVPGKRKEKEAKKNIFKKRKETCRRPQLCPSFEPIPNTGHYSPNPRG